MRICYETTLTAKAFVSQLHCFEAYLEKCNLRIKNLK